MNTCCICRNRFEAESPAILFVTAYGAKRVLCSSCEALLDRATAEEVSPEKESALAALNALASGIKDPNVLETLGEVLSGEANENAPSDEEEAKMEAIFEEIKKEEEAKEALAEPVKYTFLDYLAPAVFGVALLVFVVWYFFF